jgi:alpha-ribazole phosphatase CobZ
MNLSVQHQLGIEIGGKQGLRWRTPRAGYARYGGQDRVPQNDGKYGSCTGNRRDITAKNHSDLYMKAAIKNTTIMFEVEERLEARGIRVESIVEAAMELYVPHGISSAEARVQIKKKIHNMLKDPNVSSLLIGAMLLEDELYRKRKDSEIQEDPVFLLSDEIIGMAIAEYIGGTCARFEFTRYDQKKPGILSSLGPFLDDAVAGLIAGCTSRFYSENL